MDHNDAHLVKRLSRLSVELTEIVEILTDNAEKPVFPRSAQEKVEKRICLNCGQQVPDGARYVRGLDGPCGQEIRGVIERKESTEFELIEKGLIAPPSSGGRPKKTQKSAVKLMISGKKRSKKYTKNKAKQVASTFGEQARQLQKKTSNSQ